VTDARKQIEILYFTDILCVWAYIAQIRIDELIRNFGDRIRVENRFITVFGSTGQRIGKGWKNKGGYDGFSERVVETAKGFPHIEVNPELWKKCRPESSVTSHLFIKAAQLLQIEGTLTDNDGAVSRRTVEELIWRIRCAFFVDARDVGGASVLIEIAQEMGLSGSHIQERMLDGTALAALTDDIEQKTTFQLQGSPTILMNNGRQKLYGNVGYRVLEANVSELLESPQNQASWC
jgi:protein-disulfide isomerase-like protein with CxxC motif